MGHVVVVLVARDGVTESRRRKKIKKVKSFFMICFPLGKITGFERESFGARWAAIGKWKWVVDELLK